MPQLEQVKGKITLESDTKGAEEAKDKVMTFGDALQQVGTIAAGIGLERLAEQFFDVAKSAGEFALNYASNLEQARIAYDAFTGSAQLGGKALQEVTEFARKTPFQLPEVVEAGQQLLGFGFNVSDLTTKLREVGSLASATHTPMSVAIDLFARAREGMFNLREFGQFGISREALEKFGVSFDNAGSAINKSALLPALERLINSRFGDVLKKESETFGGTISNIKDDLGRLASALIGVDPDNGNVIRGGVFERIRTSAELFYNFIESHSGQIASLGQTISKSFDLLYNVMVKLAGHIQTAFTPVLKQLVDLYTKHKEQIDIIVQALGITLYAAVVLMINVIAGWILILTELTDNILNTFGPGLQVASQLIVDLGNNWDNIIRQMKIAFVDFVNEVVVGINKLVDAINLLPNMHLSHVQSLSYDGLGTAPTAGQGGFIGPVLPQSIGPQKPNALQQSLGVSNKAGISITNNNTFNTQTDVTQFSKMLGWQVANIK